MLSIFNFLVSNDVFLLAEASVTSSTKSGPNIFFSIFLMLAIFFIFYFLTIRPQQKRQNDLKKKIDLLKKGDFVITSGGMKVEVASVKEETFTGRLDKDTKIEFQKWCITSIEK